MKQEKINIVVLGAGAMGTFFGAALAKNGHPVTLVDVDTAHIDRINHAGVTLHQNGHDSLVRNIRAVTPDGLDTTPDLVLVFTKTTQTEAALAGIRQHISGDTDILTLQNGLGNDDIIKAFAAPDNIFIGMTTWPAQKTGLGAVAVDGNGFIRLTSLTPAGETRAAAIATLLQDAGLEAAYDPNALTAIWEKAAFNSAMNALCAVTGATVGGLNAFPESRDLVFRIARESISIARLAGIHADYAHCRATLEDALEHHTGHKPSMLQDIEAGRKTEIMSINGAFAACAARYGHDAPLNSLLTTLVRIKESAADI